MTVPGFTFHRAELYEQVWSTPMTHLASKYGLSDVGLRKIYKKLNVLTPPAGYRAKIEFGKKVQKLPLLELKYGEPDTYTLKIKPSSKNYPENDSKIKEFIAEEEKAHKITVTDRLVSPHPLVILTRDVLTKVQPDEYGVLRAWREKYLDMRVSPFSLKRALLIMDALIRNRNTGRM